MERVAAKSAAESDSRWRRHWVQQERPNEVNATLIEFLKGQ